MLTLREGELEERLRRRDKDHRELEAQVRALTVMLRKEQANAASAERRLAALQLELDQFNGMAAAKNIPIRRKVPKSSGPRSRPKLESKARPRRRSP